MPYENIPGVGATYLDGAFRTIVASNQPRVLVLGTAASGVSYNIFQINNVSGAEDEFGSSSEMLQKAHESLEQGSDNIALMRIGGTRGQLTITDPAGGFLTIRPERRDDDALDRYALVLLIENGEQRVCVFDKTDEQYVYDSSEELVLDTGLVEVIDGGLALRTCNNELSVPAGLPVGLPVDTENLLDLDTITAADLLDSVNAAGGDTLVTIAPSDGLAMSKMERYAALEQGYQFLDYLDGDFLIPAGVHVDDLNLATGATADFSSWAGAGSFTLPSPGDADDALGFLWKFLYRGKPYCVFFQNEKPFTEGFADGDLSTEVGPLATNLTIQPANGLGDLGSVLAFALVDAGVDGASSASLSATDDNKMLLTCSVDLAANTTWPEVRAELEALTLFEDLFLCTAAVETDQATVDAAQIVKDAADAAMIPLQAALAASAAAALAQDPITAQAQSDTLGSQAIVDLIQVVDDILDGDPTEAKAAASGGLANLPAEQLAGGTAANDAAQAADISAYETAVQEQIGSQAVVDVLQLAVDNGLNLADAQAASAAVLGSLANAEQEAGATAADAAAQNVQAPNLNAAGARDAAQVVNTQHDADVEAAREPGVAAVLAAAQAVNTGHDAAQAAEEATEQGLDNAEQGDQNAVDAQQVIIDGADAALAAAEANNNLTPVAIAATPMSLAGQAADRVVLTQTLDADDLPFAVMKRLLAGEDAEVRECNFGMQLAYACHRASTTWSTMIGLVSVTEPLAYTRSAIAEWVGEEPKYTFKGSDLAVGSVANNGEGVLGIKFHAGEYEYRSHKVPEDLVNDSGLAFGGYIQTTGAALPTAEPYGVNSDDEALDLKKEPIDLGKHLLVCASWPIHSNSYNGGSQYRGSLCGSLAGKLCVTPEKEEPIGINGVMRGIRRPPRMRMPLVNSLSKLRFVTTRREEGVGHIIVSAKTAAHPGSDYAKLSTIRSVNREISGIRDICKPYIGKEFSSTMLASMQTSINGFLKAEKDAGFNQGAVASISYTRADKIMGRLTIKLKMIPPFAIEAITIETTLAADESELNT